MPSIPQSLLWISLVVLWLFVLVPMLINKRDTVRRTSDVALSTRVVNGGLRSRLLRRGGPAAGHRHDPDWRPQPGDLDEDSPDYPDYPAEDDEEAVAGAVAEAAETNSEHRRARTMMVVADPADADTEPVYLDVDVVEETSGALPVGAGVQETLFEEAAEPAAETAADPTGEYEYIEDTSGLEDTGEDPEEDIGDADGAAVNLGPAPRSRRRRMESSAAAAVTARKYRFRKRMLTAMAAVMVLTAALSLTISADLWWTCTVAAVVTILYLGYLRRQTRIEAQVRRRRQQRMARFRYSDEGVDQPDPYRDVSSRLYRPGAAVLDIDDEDPAFEHLDEVPYSRRYDLPRAAGQ